MTDEIICTRCGREITIEEVAYMGPLDRDDKTCNPLADWETVCVDCDGENDD